MTIASQPPMDFQVLLRGRSKLPVVELNKNDVRTPHKRIVQPATEWPFEQGTLATTTLGHAKSELELREWDFYTAMMKTELAYSLPDDGLATRSYGAYLQHRSLLKWNSSDLRITQSGIFSRKDSARSSLAGQFGEALMYLYMVNAGYPYWDHLPSLVERVMETQEYGRADKLRIAKIFSRPVRKDGKRVREPDYAFENQSQEVALAEAKGAFVNPGDAPTMVKNGLSGGLDQAELWQKHVTPTAQRCFAIGSYLREEKDPYHDPSLIAVVDPENEDETFRSVEFPDDWIRRGNYAAWMRGMGLSQSAELLALGRAAGLPGRIFATVEVSGRTFAITHVRWLLSRRNRAPLLDFDFDFFHPYFRHCDVQVLGIEANNFRLIEKAVNVPNVALPADMAIATVLDSLMPDWFSGSIMPDGTLNAILHFDNGRIPIASEEFRL